MLLDHAIYYYVLQLMFKYLTLLFVLTVAAFSLEGVTDLNDSNFDEKVKQDQSIWLVLFAADWCGHCKHLKPEIEKVAPRLERLGVKVGQVDEKSHKLVNDYVVDHNTHMVSYPKMKIFLGSEVLAEVPTGLRNENQIYEWVRRQYQLSEITDEDL